VTSARRFSRHVTLEVGAQVPFGLDAVASEYSLHWIGVSTVPEDGPVTVAWHPPKGLLRPARRDPEEHAVAPGVDLRAKMAQAEARVSAIGARLVQAWQDKPGADAAERISWVEAAGPEILAEYQKTGAYVPGMPRHEQDQKRFARYLGVLE